MYRRSICLIAIALLSATAIPAAAADVSVDAAGITLVDHGLVGFGRIPANTKDQFGETFGSGSALALDQLSWTRNADRGSRSVA